MTGRPRMAMFVHLATEHDARAIRRAGIRLPRTRGRAPRAIYAMPVTPNFFVSHQWLRELKRRNAGPVCGIYFRIGDDERVTLGHYGRNHREMTAAEAIATVMRMRDVEGFEVTISRAIHADEIHEVRDLPQVV